MTALSTYRESSLHAALKAAYARPGDRLEAAVDGYVIDIVRDGLLIEIQTGNFTAVKTKLRRLLPNHNTLLVYPIAQAKWIVRVAADGVTVISRRKSPKRGRHLDLFQELVRLPTLLQHPHFELEIVLTHEEEIWRDDGQGSWRRRGWSIADRRLLQLVARLPLSHPTDLLQLLPANLPNPFTTADLAQAVNCPRRLAQKMAYCLRQLGLLTPVGKEGRAIAYYLNHP
jgi:hypothetical protein